MEVTIKDVGLEIDIDDEALDAFESLRTLLGVSHEDSLA